MIISQKSVDILIPYARNSRVHNDKQITQIAASIKEFGFNVPILIDETNQIIAGHGRLEAAKKLGLKEVPTIQLSHLTDAQKKAYIIADNQIALNAGWDLDLLKIDIGELDEAKFDLELLGFSEKELNKLLEPEVIEGDTEDDEVPEVTESICKPGDIWLLGKHRVMCGDSTNIQHVEILMGGKKADMVFTDPPYGVAVQNTQGSIAGDQDLEVFKNCLPMLVILAKDDAHFYVWCAPGYRLPESIWAFSQNIPFQNLLPIRVTHENKRGPKSAFKHNYESCLFGNNNAKRFNKSLKIKVSETTLKDDRYTGDGNLSVYPALWDGERATEHNMNIVHPTQKKVEMIEFYLDISSNEKEVVADLFLGSGSTLIACEKTSRICYGMEIDPHYCDVIVKRWENFTGQKAVLSNASR
jgi:DNA modification methylase